MEIGEGGLGHGYAQVADGSKLGIELSAGARSILGSGPGMNGMLGNARALPDELYQVAHALNVVLVILDEVLPADA